VSRTKVKPTTDFINWEKRDRKARTFIIVGLHYSLFQNVIGEKTIKETWDCSLKVYEIEGLSNKLFLRH
jgi:hypothetical protein